MKLILLFLLIMLPLAGAMDVSITLNINGLVKEEFNSSDDSYENYRFLVPDEPVSVIYDGEYSISKLAEGYQLIFAGNGLPLQFSLIYDGMVEKSWNKRTFRASFESPQRIRITLPESFVLSKEPGSIPKPDQITTDGVRITLLWDEADSVAVFYEDRQNTLLLIGLLLIFGLSIASFFYLRRTAGKAIISILSEDEKSIVALLRNKITKQKEIAEKLGFSKSKMSKIIRKLEEKGLLEKKPHFKTNILKLKKI